MSGDPPPGPAEGPVPEGPLGLWEGWGVELEYMIVDSGTLDVAPVADRLLARVAGEGASDAGRGAVDWSNELALHVIELKTAGPAPRLQGLAATFRESVDEVGRELGALGCRLLPGGMHPWMDPAREFRIWPHEYTEVYRAFDRVFSCRGHGWANLQSTHLNLPFRGDAEFRRLHEAVRLVLPVVPALAAASPVVDGAPGPALDNRLRAYRVNAARVPSVTGRVIPEPVASREEYRTRILEPMWRDMEPLDPEGVLRAEWLNARGAIARFERGSVEIRLVDAQEGPEADLAVTAAVARAVRSLAGGTADPAHGGPLDTGMLADVLERTVAEGERARIGEGVYLERLGLPSSGAVEAGEVWRHLLGDMLSDPEAAEWRPHLETVLERGPLARRLLEALGARRGRSALRDVWGRLADAMAAGETFLP